MGQQVSTDSLIPRYLHLTVLIRREAATISLRGALSKISNVLKPLRGDLNSELSAAQGYTVCFQRARELYQEDPGSPLKVLLGSGDLIWSYIEPLTTSGSTDIRLVRLLVEALLTFKTFLSPDPNRSPAHKTSTDKLISIPTLVDIVVDVLLSDLTSLTRRNESWKSKGRTFKACVIRTLLWIWRNHPRRTLDYLSGAHELLSSSHRLWAALEKEVGFSKSESFNDEDKPLSSDDFDGIFAFAEWVQTEIQKQRYPRRTKCTFIGRNSDVGINRLYVHFDGRASWEYHLYDLHEDSVSCSRLIYGEGGML